MKQLSDKTFKLDVFTHYLTKFKQYKNLIKSRKALLKLDDAMLKDIGITREEAEREAAKPFWFNDTDSLLLKTFKNKNMKRSHGFTKSYSKAN